MIPVIDLFAGPGGLNEGFSQLQHADGRPVFETVGSYEMDHTAVETLKLRDTFRLLKRSGGVPDEYYQFIRGQIEFTDFLAASGVGEAYAAASQHVHEVELGGNDDDSNESIEAALRATGAVGGAKPWALIGGPPCQAYSLAGRSRRANDETFAEDKKHFLYREYLRIIRTFKPSVFVMENVKGLLSSTSSGESMFAKIKKDLEHPVEGLDYEIYSLVDDREPSLLKPSDFIIRAERYGVPQKRHRVILLGVKSGFLKKGKRVGRLEPREPVTINSALVGMPKLRSRISPLSVDTQEAWYKIRDALGKPSAMTRGLQHGSAAAPRTGEPPDSDFAGWIIDPRLDDVIQHVARSHMIEDLKRYRFAALEAQKARVSPRLRSFPKHLLPKHRNAAQESHPFEDRFRVQVGTAAANTIVSHISKDGHYYIHPDPDQMRSLTVREAARLQTFPDNYFFMGNRTQQYHQVGNAVPPLLANQIAAIVAAIFDNETTSLA